LDGEPYFSFPFPFPQLSVAQLQFKLLGMQLRGDIFLFRNRHHDLEETKTETHIGEEETRAQGLREAE